MNIDEPKKMYMRVPIRGFAYIEMGKSEIANWFDTDLFIFDEESWTVPLEKSPYQIWSDSSQEVKEKSEAIIRNERRIRQSDREKISAFNVANGGKHELY